MKKFIGLLFLILIPAIVLFWFSRKTVNKSKITIPEIKFDLYQNIKGGYEINIPANWNVVSSSDAGLFTSRKVWQVPQAGPSIGNTEQISVTVLASPSAGQPLSTQKEFDTWYERNNGEAASESGIVKVKNEVISGLPAIRMKEELIIKENIQSSFFSQTSWFIQNHINYYINVMGNGLFTDTDSKYFELILKSFRLI